jgi:hypothetical protein
MWRLIISLVEWAIKRIQYKGRIEDKLDAMLIKQVELARKVCRLEILDAMRRGDRAVVHQLYYIYKNEYAGNSYMQELYKDYCKKPNKRSKK